MFHLGLVIGGPSHRGNPALDVILKVKDLLAPWTKLGDGPHAYAIATSWLRRGAA